MLEIYDFFDKDGALIYTAENIENLTQDILDQICMFEISSEGAMGEGGLLLLIASDGQTYPVKFGGAVYAENEFTEMYRTKAFDYIDRYFSNGISKMLANQDFPNEWKYVTNGLGWYIAAKTSDLLEQLSSMEHQDEALAISGIEDLVMHFPSYARKVLQSKVGKPMVFYDERHENAYNDICSRMKYLDCYHRSLAYLLALDAVLREHIEAVFDFKEDAIKIEGLSDGFQTGMSMKTTRLAFNLWNGCNYEGEEYTDKDGYKVPLPSSCYAPDQIFCCKEYAPYYWQAIQIRFEIA